MTLQQLALLLASETVTKKPNNVSLDENVFFMIISSLHKEVSLLCMRVGNQKMILTSSRSQYGA